jgi:hypothetical protein
MEKVGRGGAAAEVDAGGRRRMRTRQMEEMAGDGGDGRRWYRWAAVEELRWRMEMAGDG